jgi:formylglycine-generating enzyme required for sulfatase activity
MYNRAVRLLPAILLLAFAAHAAESPAWPFWDGQETIEQYARRAGLEPTKTLDLGDGVKLELVLIPAGKFVMGTPRPTPVDDEGYRRKIVIGKAVLAAGVGVLLVLLGTVVIRAVRQRRRPQYSLARFVAIIVAAGVGLLGGLHWHFSPRAFSDAKSEYQAARARFKDAGDWEKPAHEVTISRPYYLGEFEVTQEQYQQVMGVNPSQFKGRDLPVEYVQWDEAQEFCRKASERTGQTVRLPTEAEWEHACRASTKTSYYSGDGEADLERAAWYYRNSMNTTHPVGQKVPNAWGVHDTHGNVFEWCADWYGVHGAEAATDPQGPSQGEYRVLRGGSWDSDPRNCRSANRGGSYPDLPYDFFGFRVAAEVPSKTP